MFEYFQKLPEKEFPDTLEEMLPLYRAVTHGCLSGEFRQALFGVFDKRIQRGDKHYSSYFLAAYSQDITALSPFKWKESNGYGLTKKEQIWLLKQINHCFMSLGLLNKAVEVSIVSLNLSTELENWRESSSIARGLVNSYQPLGELGLSINIAIKSIDYARNDKNDSQQILNYCRLAHILHLMGNLVDAEEYCQKAESSKQKEGVLYLTTVPCFRYCDLLLDKVNDQKLLREIISRGECILQNYSTQLDPALGNLIIARTYFYLNEFTKAAGFFLSAMRDMQVARRMEFMPPFYFARADFCLTQNKLENAEADLNSAYEIIERCGMKLYQVDYLLIHGRYSLATSDFNTAVSHYDEAKQLIQETGYHLRDAELDLFAAQICHCTHQDLHTKNADFYLQKAKNRIEEIGQWGLMPRWEQVAQANS